LQRVTHQLSLGFIISNPEMPGCVWPFEGWLGHDAMKWLVVCTNVLQSQFATEAIPHFSHSRDHTPFPLVKAMKNKLNVVRFTNN